MPPDVLHHFYGIYINSVTNLNNETYSITAAVLSEGKEFFASFDFDCKLFEVFINQVPTDKRITVKNYLRAQPFRYDTNCEEDSFKLTFTATLGDRVFTSNNGYEQYIPFNIVSFF